MIFPRFIVKKTKDLMVRGGKFYAIWDESRSLWSTDPFSAIEIIDRELDKFKTENPQYEDAYVAHLRDSDNGYIAKWSTYIEKHMSDIYVPLDESLHFSGVALTREDYASKYLPYAFCDGPHDAWDELINVLYSPEERHKIEWTIGCIASGDSKATQKFLVFYGSGGTGKSTIIDIIKKLFEGYWDTFSAKDLGSANASFAMEPLAKNPLVAIDPDADLSHIEDNTRINAIVSHDVMTVNEKFSKQYSMRFNSFIIIATNKPVRITDAKSGLIRRLIDVSPTGNTFKYDKYLNLTEKVKFELSGILTHCLKVYKSNPRYYDKYIPEKMLGESNEFFNFVSNEYEHFKTQNYTTLREAWERYNEFVKEARITYPLTQMRFKAELKNYFDDFKERTRDPDGKQVWNYYYGFKTKLFSSFEKEEFTIDGSEMNAPEWIELKEGRSIFDIQFADSLAQYADEEGKPIYKWDNVKTTLKDIDTSKTHYIRLPEYIVVIDFDLKDENGNKSLAKNLEAANKWPATYTEVSKSGSGIHLHYFYIGDPKELSRIYGDGIEIKVFTGKSSLRRRLTLHNDISIQAISSGLPTQEKNVVIEAKIKSERALRDLIIRNLRKEIMKNTTPSINFIAKILDDAYASGLTYDIRDMRPAIEAFANNSTNQANYCLKKTKSMKFSSASTENVTEASNEAPIVIFDVESYPNFFGVAWKTLDGPVVKWKRPKSYQIEELIKYRLVGFNNRGYDNHMLYARLMGYTDKQLNDLSRAIINKSPNATFREALNLSYTDIYDFSSEKKSLKKFEIEYGIHHQEMGIPWDQDVPPELEDQVMDYCANDVLATQVVWERRQGDFLAREILAELTGMTVNDTTNQLTTRLIFGDNFSPQDEFVYTKLNGEDVPDDKKVCISEIHSLTTNRTFEVDSVHTVQSLTTGQMIFPGYYYGPKEGEKGDVSIYRGVKVGEGGYVYADPGMYFNVTTKDVTSMHPSSIIALNLFGDRYTKIFKDLVRARVGIKHGLKNGDYSEVSNLFDGRLNKYLEDPKKAKMLVGALKIAINSVYGLTAAKFTNAFRDPRNVDNIVAKRGALFMINLMNEVEAHGGKVVHIKTDSIKVESLDPELEDFIRTYGELYGYYFETEHVFNRMCLVNDAVYIAKCAEDDPETPNEWTATGKQFAVPYVFKKLFSHEPIEFEDMVETINVSSALYLDMNEGMPDVEPYEKKLKALRKNPPNDITEMIDLENRIELGHNYVFVGKVGAFCPIKPGCGGGWLMRQNDGGYGFATGTKDFRWLEAEVVKKLGKEDDIDVRYYNKLLDAAVAAISEQGDFEAFTAD